MDLMFADSCMSYLTAEQIRIWKETLAFFNVMPQNLPEKSEAVHEKVGDSS
jgi:hypothetical protein